MKHSLPALAPFLAAALSAAPAADVLVVDASGGGDFLDVQPAVDAAAPGDVVLVASGIYGPVTVLAGDLVLAAEPKAHVILEGGLEIRGTSPGAAVTVVGMDLRGVNAGQREGLVVEDCDGPVRAADLSVLGANGSAFLPPERGADAVRIAGSADVVIARSSLVAGSGAPSFSGGEANRGGSGVHAAGSSVALFDCGLAGGDGGDGDFLSRSLGGEAGHGAQAIDAFLFASGGRFRGGDGGGDDLAACEPGGHGLLAQGAGSAAHLVDVALDGGAGACFQPPGEPFSLEGGAALAQLPGPARSLGHPPVAPAATSLSIELSGAAGETVVLVASDATALSTEVLFGGVLVVPPPWLASPVPLGVLDASGEASVSLPLPSLPPGAGAFPLHLQAVHAGTPGASLGAPSPLVLLEALP